MLKKNNFWLGLLYIIILVILGVTCYRLYTINQEITKVNVEKINLLDEKLRQSESIIDSLENTVSLRESLIDSLSFSRQEVIIEKKIVVNEVRELPLNDAVLFLRKEITEYEKNFEDYYLHPDSIAP
jgi:hypothetical protein